MKKITITEKQAFQFNQMRAMLIKIHKEYQTPTQMRRDSEKQYGLDFEETIEYAYENIQNTAKYAVKGIKAYKSMASTHCPIGLLQNVRRWLHTK